jgi:hypothetical protein
MLKIGNTDLHKTIGAFKTASIKAMQRDADIGPNNGGDCYPQGKLPKEISTKIGQLRLPCKD